jgi:GH24 family phage-related lysozyme (muramidase)
MTPSKGTGWIPDFPDIRDYRLSDIPPQQVVNTAGNETIASVLERLTNRMVETFESVVDVKANAEAAIALQKIEQEFLSGPLSFHPVQVHQYLTPGTRGPEVLRTKYYLQKYFLEAIEQSEQDQMAENSVPDPLSEYSLSMPFRGREPMAQRISEEHVATVLTLYRTLRQVIRSDVWWFQQVADERFTHLLELYQRICDSAGWWIPQLVNEELVASDEEARQRVQAIISEHGGWGRLKHKGQSHRVDGILDPETLAMFEIKSTQKVFDRQLNELRNSIDKIAVNNPETAICYFENPATSSILHRICEDLCAQSDSLIPLKNQFLAIHHSYFLQYLDQTLPQAGVAIVKEFEGLRLQAYQDSVGVWTIGYGHTSGNAEPAVEPGTQITESEAEEILRRDLLFFAKQIRTLVTVPCNTHQFGALLSFTFNVGVGALKNSTLLKRLNEEKFEEAADEFERWVKAGGTTLPGLVKRRAAEKALFQTVPESPSEAFAEDFVEQHRRLSQQLMTRFRDELLSALSAMEQRQPKIDVKRLTLSWQLPEAVDSRLRDGVFNCIQTHLFQRERQIEIEIPQSNETESKPPKQEIIGKADFNDYREEILELLLPVIHATMHHICPMGRHSLVYREVDKSLSLLDQIFLTTRDNVSSPMRSPSGSVEFEQNDVSKHELTSLKQALDTAFLKVDDLSKIQFYQLHKEYRALDKHYRDAKDAIAQPEEDLYQEKLDQEKIKKAQLEYKSAAEQRRRVIAKYRKYYIASKLIEAFVRHYPHLFTEAAAASVRSHQPTLLYIPSHPSTADDETSSVCGKYSDSLHIPLKQGQRLFEADERSPHAAPSKTWRYLVLPEFIDLSYWCSPIEDQGSLNSCTAQAGVALVEYFAKRTFGQYDDLSARFLYKVARKLMHRVGDSGASLRETMRAMVLFGVPPEEHWPYTESAEELDCEPDQFCYAYAQNYQTVKYCRLDHAGMSEWALLAQIKAVLVAGLPCMFGVTIYKSIHADYNVKLGHIPFHTRLGMF